jgi:hypothetical protein
MTVAAHCAETHVIDNEDFGVEPVKLTNAGTSFGTCERCRRDAKIRRCWRCGRYFCVPESR